MVFHRSGDSTLLLIRIVILATGAAVAAGLFSWGYSLANPEESVAQYLASGATATELRSAFEARYLSDCRDETKQVVLAGDDQVSLHGVESLCGCSLRYFLQHSGVDDVRAIVERGETTHRGAEVQARAHERCRDKLTEP